MERRRAKDTAEILGLATQGYDVVQDSEGFRISFGAPPSSPYAPERLTLLLALSPNHPWDPPDVRFGAPIPLHPNIDIRSGAVCVGAARRPPGGSWTPVAGCAAVVAAVVVLLGEPNAEDPLNIEAASLLRRDTAEYCLLARRSVTRGGVTLGVPACVESPATPQSKSRLKRHYEPSPMGNEPRPGVPPDDTVRPAGLCAVDNVVSDGDGVDGERESHLPGAATDATDTAMHNHVPVANSDEDMPSLLTALKRRKRCMNNDR